VIACAVVELSSTGQVCEALRGARQIDLQAYTVWGPALKAVEAAAQRGAQVTVALEGQPFNNPHLAKEHRNLAAQLRAAGAAVTLGHPLHAKALTVDGTLYLDEKNWRPGDLVLRVDDPGEAATIPMVKHEALAREGELIGSATSADHVIVESESFGCCNEVYSELRQAALAGAAPRLLVSSRELSGNVREREVLEALVRDGVTVRVCDDSEKLAVAGDAAWLGSANATIAAPDSDSTDWGLDTCNATIVAAVRSRLETQWQNSRAFSPSVSRRAALSLG
jgi:phosphatidylserine/phosphatidylglycerophosphate/cardiolipin synthase-like enzyme